MNYHDKASNYEAGAFRAESRRLEALDDEREEEGMEETCEYCGHDHAPDPFYCIARLQERIEAMREQLGRIATLSDGNPNHASPKCMLAAIHEIAEDLLRDEQGIREARDSVRNGNVHPIFRGIINSIGRGKV